MNTNTSSSRQPSPIRYSIGRGRGWLLKPGVSCSLGRAGDRLLRFEDSGASRPCFRMWHTGEALMVEKEDPRLELSFGGARFDRAQLPLDGQFRLAGQVVRYHQVRRNGAAELLPGLVGRASGMQELARVARRAAQFQLPALILGESGTGKELVARALHQLGPRAAGPFVVINAAVLSDGLGGSALFGHVRGAYTGAEQARQGAFRRAHGGTLFLDEVAELTPSMQAQLLRVVEYGAVAALGEDGDEEVDVRLVAATCKPLDVLACQHNFRHDLLQRLAAHKLELPPLRKRRSDVPIIAERLLEQPALIGHRLAPDALDPLAHHPFAGNVRELRNLLTQAALYCDAERVIAADAMVRAVAAISPSEACLLPPPDAYELWLRAGRNASRAARHAGLARSTFKDQLSKARLRRQQQPPSARRDAA